MLLLKTPGFLSTPNNATCVLYDAMKKNPMTLMQM